MSRKNRLEIHVDPPLMAWIRDEAKRLGVSLGAIVRTALREFMDRVAALDGNDKTGGPP